MLDTGFRVCFCSSLVLRGSPCVWVTLTEWLCLRGVGRFQQSHRRLHEQSTSASAVNIDLCFLTEKEKCGFAWSHEFIKATWKGREWGPNLPRGRPGQVKRNRYLGSLLPQMSFRPQRSLRCLRSHGPLLTSDFTGGEEVGRMEVVFWRNYHLLVFLPS